MGAQQKVAIITGASQGIGEALVKAYRDRNFRVVATSRSIKQSSDPDVLAVAGDIADPKTAERVVSHIGAVGMASDLRSLNRRFSAAALIGHMRRDKKVRDGALHFVLVRIILAKGKILSLPNKYPLTFR